MSVHSIILSPVSRIFCLSEGYQLPLIEDMQWRWTNFLGQRSRSNNICIKLLFRTYFLSFSSSDSFWIGIDIYTNTFFCYIYHHYKLHGTPWKKKCSLNCIIWYIMHFQFLGMRRYWRVWPSVRRWRTWIVLTWSSLVWVWG